MNFKISFWKNSWRYLPFFQSFIYDNLIANKLTCVCFVCSFDSWYMICISRCILFFFEFCNDFFQIYSSHRFHISLYAWTNVLKSRWSRDDAFKHRQFSLNSIFPILFVLKTFFNNYTRFSFSKEENLLEDHWRYRLISELCAITCDFCRHVQKNNMANMHLLLYIYLDYFFVSIFDEISKLTYAWAMPLLLNESW